MFTESLYPKTKQVLDRLSNEPWLTNNFYLAGGTALALQIGHRKSIDIDLFTTEALHTTDILSNLDNSNIKIIHEAQNTLDLLINDVKVSFLTYKYPLTKETTQYNSLKLTSLQDIGAMKISAVSSRGAKKDLIDIYFLLQKYSLQELLLHLDNKFEGVTISKAYIYKSLLNFTDADLYPQVDFLTNTSWSDIKSYLKQVVPKYK